MVVATPAFLTVNATKHSIFMISFMGSGLVKTSYMFSMMAVLYEFLCNPHCSSSYSSLCACFDN